MKAPLFISPRRNSGMSLLELLIALTLGVLISAGLIQVFQGNKLTYRLTEAQSRLQENGRYVLELLTKDIRMGGYQGCRTIGDITPIVIADAPVTPLTINAVITGNGGSTATPPTTTWTPALSATLAAITNPAVTPGTDVITIQYAGSCGGYLVGNLLPNNANIQIAADNTCGINAGDVLLISDCSSAHIFRATNTPNGSGKHTIAHAKNKNDCSKFRTGATCDPGDDTQNKTYGPDAELYTFRSYSYFIRTGASDGPSLWRLDNSKATSSSNPIEVLDGIENIQIQYGIDSDADGVANQYQDAAGGTAWNNLVSLRISVLTRTNEDYLTPNPQTYSYNGTTVTASDHRIRRVFTTTVGIRNLLN